MGLSVAGLTLGLISLGAWLLFSTAIFALIMGTQPNRDVARQFITDLGAGNTAAAQQQTAKPFTTRGIQVMSDLVKSHGTVTDVTTLQTNVVDNDATLSGVVTFGAAGKQPFSMTQTKVGGTWKVDGFFFGSDPPSSSGTSSGTDDAPTGNYYREQ